ncbi:hypothetical protein KUV51_21325 [Tateyamaria omphalii]|uniref:hypothetical protein n=1 Tax=Tateyamaria omphalii TaxID=299262 RepID=UPI001C9990F4|nr:hypothetical protein [Tateyamaria omphalii]MBY5935564.1 hypothetical protein [Tateyamaria omphalii]
MFQTAPYSLIRRAGTALLMIVTSATVLWADAPQPVQQNNSSAVWFENWQGLSNATMTISTPTGEVIQIFAATGTPVYELRGTEIVDGVYRYELTAATDERRKIVNQIDNGRGDAARDTAAVPFATGGAFVVSRGVIVQPEDIKEE